MQSFESIQRPQRWDVPYSEDMTDVDVEELLGVEPFRSIDRKKFRGKFSLEGILKNDSRLLRFEKGDIVVRQGDWGNSAFFVISGSLQANLEGPEDLPSEILGRQPVKRKGLFEVFAQMWSGSKDPESRNIENYRADNRVGTRGSGSSARIFLQDVASVLDENQTAQIQHGQFFGELSALGRTPREATVFADRQSLVLEIRWQGLRDIVKRDEKIREHIESVFRERALKWFLLKTALFDHLGKEDISRLVEEAQFDTFGEFDWAGDFKRLAKKGADSGLENEPLIAREGDHPNGAIILRSGLARLSRQHENGHRTVGYLTPGHIYGLNEMVHGWVEGQPMPLENSLRAIGIANVIVIPTQLVESLLLQKLSRAELSRRFSISTKKRGIRQAESQPEMTDGFVEFLVQRRFVNGTATMLIDMDRCTRCDDCVRACATTHDNNPRFLRNGPIYDNIMVANACMHCEDPVCMIQCPTGAIHRDLRDGQVVINDQTCIGCSACANNCPYSAIRMVNIRQDGGDFIRDAAKHTPIEKATKCDLCVDQWGGPACQRACPHDALIRMDMSSASSLTDWLNR